MDIRLFHNNELSKTQYSSPPPKDRFQIVECDSVSMCQSNNDSIVLFDFQTPSMNNWRAGINQDTVEVKATVLTAGYSNPQKIIDTFKNKYQFNVNITTEINITTLYYNTIGNKIKDILPIQFEPYMDSQRFGINISLSLNGVDNIQNRRTFDFVVPLSLNKLTVTNLRENLKDWLNETRKMHQFINKFKNKILEFDDFATLISDKYNIILRSTLYKSYFQQFKSFVTSFDIDRFSDLAERDTSKYEKIKKLLSEVGKYAPVYNFKGVRLQPYVNTLSATFIGTPIVMNDQNPRVLDLILTTIETFDQLDKLENQIDRTLLLNS